MTQTVPLIRAANILPLVRWIEENRLDTDGYLESADLGYWFALSPHDPVPLLNGIDLLRRLACDHGPEVGSRIVNQASIAELGFIGGVALGARTPFEALNRLSFAMPMHSSHEVFRVSQQDDQVVVHHVIGFSTDPESLHAIHVLLTSMIQQVLRFTGLQPPLLRQVDMVPHPEFGLSRVEPDLSNRVRAAKKPALTISIDLAVASNPFRVVARDRSLNVRIARIPPLAEDRSLAASVRPVIAAMLHGGEPTLERMARAYGRSVRTLQRRLADEGTSFSEQLDLVRRDLALALLDEEDLSLADLSERLGYSAQSALTRAVRRLTGHTPSQLAEARLG